MKRVYVIAEAGVNHNGSLDAARKLVDAATEAGADAVKFQSFRAEKLVIRRAPKANYQLETTDSQESQFEMLKKLELSDEAHHELLAYCQKTGIEFLSTPFDQDGIRFLSDEIKVQRLKLPSGEITNAPFLLDAARTRKPVIFSSGMSSLSDVENALQILAYGYLNPKGRPSSGDLKAALNSEEGKLALRKNVTVLHCTTEYPAPFASVNLKAMATIREAFGITVGLSDHTEGISIPLAAVALGAAVIEKHFTLDRNLPGPDHKASLEPAELKAMVAGIREIEQALGDGRKEMSSSEAKNRDVIRKSLVTLKPIRQGDKFTEENLGVKRPGSGVSPMLYWEYLGRASDRDYAADTLVQE